MKRIKYIVNTLLMVFSCSNASGEAISEGKEAYFQITPTLEAGGVVSNTKKENIAPMPESNDENAFGGFEGVFGDDFEGVFNNFIKTHKNNKRGMVIGRGNVQGIAEEKITIDSLKGLKWLFVDPGDTLGDRFYNNTQDRSQGNALKTTWPVDFSINEAFDAVVFDYGTLQYIGDDGTEKTLTAHNDFIGERDKLSVVFIDGMSKTVDSDGEWYREITVEPGDLVAVGHFQDPHVFYLWLEQNEPDEYVGLKAKHEQRLNEDSKKRAEAHDRQRRGLKDAYTSLRVGGTLIIPIDITLEGLDLAQVLGVSKDILVKTTLTVLKTESPVLPENQNGMGAGYGDYYAVKKPQKL